MLRLRLQEIYVDTVSVEVGANWGYCRDGCLSFLQSLVILELSSTRKMVAKYFRKALCDSGSEGEFGNCPSRDFCARSMVIGGTFPLPVHVGFQYGFPCYRTLIWQWGRGILMRKIEDGKVENEQLGSLLKHSTKRISEGRDDPTRVEARLPCVAVGVAMVDYWLLAKVRDRPILTILETNHLTLFTTQVALKLSTPRHEVLGDPPMHQTPRP